MAAVKLQLISCYEIVEKTYLVILMRGTTYYRIRKNYQKVNLAIT